MLEDRFGFLRNLRAIANGNSAVKRSSCKLGDKEDITYKIVNRED